MVGALEELRWAAAQFTTFVERRKNPAWGASHCATAATFAGSEEIRHGSCCLLGHRRLHLLPALGQNNCLESALKPRIECWASLPTVHFLWIYDLQGRSGRFVSCAEKIGLGNSLIDGWL